MTRQLIKRTLLLLGVGAALVGGIFFLRFSMHGRPGVYGKHAQDFNTLNNAGIALREYKKFCGQFPSEEEGFSALLASGVSKCEDAGTAASSFLVELPKNVWGEPIIYQILGDQVRFISLGKDRRPGGTNDDEDIVYDPVKKLISYELPK